MTLVLRKIVGVASVVGMIFATGCDKKPTEPVATSGCWLIPEDANLGNVVVGSSEDVTITLTNVGTTDLAGVLILSQQGASFALIGSNVYNLGAGQSNTFTLRFQPVTAGSFVCTIATSPAACQATCSGIGVAGATWTNLTPTGTNPSARASHAAIYDPVRHRIVVFGGNDGTPGVPHLLNDVWTLSLTGSPAWTQLTTAGTPPSPRATHTAIYDPGLDRIVVFGGFDGSNRLNDTWTLTLAGTPTWAPLAPAGAPSARGLHTAIHDPIGGRMLVFGGLDEGLNYRNDVWALSLTGSPTWTQLTPGGTSPSARASHAAIFDPLRNRMLAFGGYGDGHDQDDVWALSLTASPAWTQLAPMGTPPSARQGHSAIYDAAGDRMLLFGGYNESDRVFYDDVWYLSLGSSGWTPVVPSGTPPSARRSHSAIYDPVDDRMMMFGGNDIFGFRADVWALK